MLSSIRGQLATVLCLMIVFAAHSTAATADTAAYWRGVIQFAEAQGVPTYMFEWNQRNRTRVVSTTGGAKYEPSQDRIYIPTLNYRRAVRAGQGDDVLGPQRQPIELDMNEAFHAWFDQHANRSSRCRGFMRTISNQTQWKVNHPLVWLRGPSVKFMAEEAVSEMLATMVGVYRSHFLTTGSARDQAPSYGEARTNRSLELTPAHNEPGEKWSSPQSLKNAADRPMKADLYQAATRIFHGGC